MYKTIALAACAVLALTAAFARPACAALNPLAFYHLGEADAGVVVGGPVSTTVESLGLRPDIDMTPGLATTDLKYSSDTPPSITSTRSIVFDAGTEFLQSFATKWYEGTGGFRWGAEMFIKPDASLAGAESIFFTNGTQFTMGMTAEGRFFVNTTGPGTTPVKYGQWQHVAFFTSGSSWQIYVDGVPQFTTLPNFTYGAPSGIATLGSNNAGDSPFTGLIDEHRVFTWTGSFNPNELLWYQGRKAGDVNEDGSVNSADYDIWRANVGADLSALTALQGRALGDMNGDRQINLVDFGIIKTNKTGGGSFGVPEPSSVALLVAALACGLRRRRARATRVAAVLSAAVVAASLLPASTASAQAPQAVWGGGNGNWNDANWSGGSGPGGRPGAGDDILIPASTGTLTVSTNIGSTFGLLRQEGGIVDITAAGVLDLGGNYEHGRGSSPTSELRLAGSLNVGGELDVAFDASGRVRFLGNGTLTTTGNMDTWWTGNATVDLDSATTNITVGATYYYGPAATVNANISSAALAPIKALGDVSLQGGTLNVNFTGGYVPTFSNSWNLFDTPTLAGAITNVNSTGLLPGMRLAVSYADGGTLGKVVKIDVDPTLNLKVDRSNGVLTLENPAVGATAVSIDGYIIKSATTALNPAGFTGVGQPGWLPGTTPSQTNKIISETNFNGSLSIAQGASFPLGTAFAGGAAQDLSLEFHLTTGEVLLGTVQYVGTPSFAADFDGNGIVNGADLTRWKTNYGKAAGAVKAEGDFNLDGRVDGADFLGWQRQLGSGAATGATAAVPEPASWTLAGLTALVAVARRRRS